LAGNPRDLKTYFDSQSKNSAYMIFSVFEDSFRVFLMVKQMAVGSGLAYGCPNSRHIIPGSAARQQSSRPSRPCGTMQALCLAILRTRFGRFLRERGNAHGLVST
jgi:hypothetical protein